LKRLVLVGGGHAHVEVLRRFGLAPLPGVELVLVSPGADTPYSGMLPGLVAGHYTRADIHIDLEALARFGRARFVRTAVTALDASAQSLLCADGQRLSYDLASLDIGSTPPLDAIPGAAETGIAVKPVDRFLRYWEAILDYARRAPVSVAVVGAGAGGVEIALAMKHRAANEGADIRVVLVADRAGVMPTHAPGVRRRVLRALADAGVGVVGGARVAQAEGDRLLLHGGAVIEAQAVVWATGAAAPEWLAETGLALDDRGFIEVRRTLQSTSHPNVFAAGDVASVRGHPRPKSGVYAVRQGPPLAENLRRVLQGRKPRRFTPQRLALALISTGGKHAIASWGPVALAGDWVWRWKDAIDRKFMARFRSLP
jgi:selenide,water dikinase